MANKWIKKIFSREKYWYGSEKNLNSTELVGRGRSVTDPAVDLESENDVRVLQNFESVSA